MALNTTVFGLRKIARNIYIKAQNYKPFVNTTLTAGSLSDRLLNKSLGFTNHKQRLNYLKIRQGYEFLTADTHKDKSSSNETLFFFRWMVSEFRGLASDIIKGARLSYYDFVRFIYVRAQYRDMIGNKFLAHDGTADRVLNDILGFKDREERLKYLLNNMILYGASLAIKSLEQQKELPAMSKVLPLVFFKIQSRLNKLTMDRLWKDLRQVQLKFDPLPPTSFRLDDFYNNNKLGKNPKKD